MRSPSSARYLIRSINILHESAQVRRLTLSLDTLRSVLGYFCKKVRKNQEESLEHVYVL